MAAASWSVAGSQRNQMRVCSGFPAFFLGHAQHGYEKDHKPHSKALSTLTQNTPTYRTVEDKK